jgi:hypothetical protein
LQVVTGARHYLQLGCRLEVGQGVAIVDGSHPIGIPPQHRGRHLKPGEPLRQVSLLPPHRTRQLAERREKGPALAITPDALVHPPEQEFPV